MIEDKIEHQPGLGLLKIVRRSVFRVHFIIHRLKAAIGTAGGTFYAFMDCWAWEMGEDMQVRIKTGKMLIKKLLQSNGRGGLFIGFDVINIRDAQNRRFVETWLVRGRS